MPAGPKILQPNFAALVTSMTISTGMPKFQPI